MTKRIHVLTEKDTVNKTGICANCGPVKIRYRPHKKLWLCSVADNLQSRGVKGLIHPKPDACEICGRKSRLVGDHDHATGMFRGWLCHSCNFMLGRAKDNPAVFEAAITYLQRGK